MPRRTRSAARTGRTRDGAVSFKLGSFKSGKASARDCIWELSTVGESQRMVCQEGIRLTEEQVHEVRGRVQVRVQVNDAEVWPDGRICPKPKCHSRRSGYFERKLWLAFPRKRCNCQKQPGSRSIFPPSRRSP